MTQDSNPRAERAAEAKRAGGRGSALLGRVEKEGRVPLLH
jgi:hypothetical protein